MPLKDYNHPSLIWKEFTVGEQKFWIQNIEDIYVEGAVDVMVNGYLREEPIAYFSRAHDDVEYRSKFEVSCREIFKRGYSLVCLTIDENGKTVIAGVHCLDLVPYADVVDEFIFGHSFLWHLLRLNDICLKLNIQKYLVDRGMFVCPKFRRKGISGELLKCWSPLCKKLQVEICLGSFTSKYSHKSAIREGLTELNYMPYVELRKVFPEQIPVGIETFTEGMSLLYVRP